MPSLTMEEVLRQVAETRSRDLWKLPVSWWEDKVAERMSDYIVRFQRNKV